MRAAAVTAGIGVSAGRSGVVFPVGRDIAPMTRDASDSDACR